jgi:hypothetical protein
VAEAIAEAQDKMIFEGIFRRFYPLKSGRGPIDARFTSLESLAVAQVESEHLEMTRAGRRFAGIFSTTGIGTVQAVPTTTANWLLYNADPARSYVIDQVTAFFISGTAGIGGTLLGIVSPITATIPGAATGAAVCSSSAGGLVSKAVLAVTYTLPAPVSMTQWMILPGQQGQTTGVIPGLGGNFTADVRGRVLVPPGKALGLALVTAVGTAPLYIMGVQWHEAEHDLE